MDTNKPVFSKFLRQAQSSNWEKSRGWHENTSMLIQLEIHTPLYFSPILKIHRKNAKRKKLMGIYLILKIILILINIFFFHV